MRPVRRLTVFWLLELIALALVFLQLPGGVRTDEAKYLLSIPYPHPPLMRSVMAWTSSMPQHEFFWRFLIASLTVQTVWIIADLADVLTRPRKICLAAAWLLSAAVILQGGTVVMAVVSALFGMVFVWLALHPETPRPAAFTGLLWMASLFISYQSVLYAPLVLSVLLRSRQPKRVSLLYFAVPLVLLALYSLGNPLILASMAQVSAQDAAMPVLQRAARIGWVWLIAGSAVLSLAGTVGVITSNRLDLVAAFGLVLGYIVLTSQHYYAILLTPVFIGGTYLLLCRRRLRPGVFLFCETACAALMVTLAFPVMHTTSARSVMQALRDQGVTGPVLIDGPFGHEWQYESTVPVLRFSDRLSVDAERSAQAFVCTKAACDNDVNLDEWVRLADMPLPTWTRR